MAALGLGFRAEEARGARKEEGRSSSPARSLFGEGQQEEGFHDTREEEEASRK